VLLARVLPGGESALDQDSRGDLALWGESPQHEQKPGEDSISAEH